MKKIMMLWMIACLAGCSYFVSIDELARNIQEQMQREFNANPEYQHYHLTVVKVKVVHRKGNEFEAVSQLNYQGHEYPINVKITKANGGYSWLIEDDAFAFIDEIEVEKYRQQLDRELEQLAASLEDLEPVAEPKMVEPDSNIRAAAKPVVQVASYDEEPIPVGNITAYTR